MFFHSHKVKRTRTHTPHRIGVVVIHARIILFCSKIHFGGRNKSRSIDQSNELRTFRIVQRFRHLLDKCRPLIFSFDSLCVPFGVHAARLRDIKNRIVCEQISNLRRWAQCAFLFLVFKQQIFSVESKWIENKEKKAFAVMQLAIRIHFT